METKVSSGSGTFIHALKDFISPMLNSTTMKQVLYVADIFIFVQLNFMYILNNIICTHYIHVNSLD